MHCLEFRPPVSQGITNADVLSVQFSPTIKVERRRTKDTASYRHSPTTTTDIATEQDLKMWQTDIQCTDLANCRRQTLSLSVPPPLSPPYLPSGTNGLDYARADLGASVAWGGVWERGRLAVLVFMLLKQLRAPCPLDHQHHL